MGSSKFEEIPKEYVDGVSTTMPSGQTLHFIDEEIKWVDSTTKFVKGIVINSVEGFFMRLWLVLSNPLRYILTGRIRY